jgi:phenylpyruvate tautomerase PptA (4-oxalocrotonate tautomerase family)
MPLVRIDLLKSKDAAYRQRVGRVVHDALVSVGVPAADRFQIIGEHAAENFQFDSDYLGIHRSENLVMIQITWNEGRSTDQKRALYKAIADGLHSAVGLRPEDALVNLIEVKKENWSFGNGIAQYAV